ncbi:MAG: ribonuclease III, partial [Selenomonas artemidis]
MAEGLSPARRAELERLAAHMGVAFSNIALLDEALTHPSYANESRDSIPHNERLEFLGDAVLELASSTYLYK